MTKKHKGKTLRPLKIKAKCVSSGTELLKNIKYAITLKLPELTPMPFAHDGSVALVGAGPTVKNFVTDIKQHQEALHPVVAIKGSHDWLVDQGIIPNACTAVDPQENQTRYFQKMQKNTVYLFASQCHPKLFNHFLHGEEKYPVVLWHCFADVGEKEILKNRPLVLGGTTSGLRTMYLMYMLGFRKFHLYGFDSSGNTGVSGHVSHEKMIQVIVGGREFYATPAMIKQAEEMQMILQNLKNIDLFVHGEGLMSAVIAEMIRKAEEAQKNANNVSPETGQEQSVKSVQTDNPREGTDKAGS